MNTNEEDKMLSMLPTNAKENPFAVPGDYFDSLQETINAGVFIQNLKERVSTGGFTVPENYFDSLTETLNHRISGTISGAEVSEKSDNIRQFQPSFVKYAAAACFALGASAVIFFYTSTGTSTVKFDGVSEEEIANYLKVDAEADDADLLIENINMDKSFTSFHEEISDRELEQYINSTSL